MILASADGGSDTAGVDDPGEATQIANVDHAATITAGAPPLLKPGSTPTSAINPEGGSYTVQQEVEARDGIALAVSAEGETDMHTVERQTRVSGWLQGGR